jgi:hypothetical protein
MTSEFAISLLQPASQTPQVIGDFIVMGSSSTPLMGGTEYYIPVAKNIDGTNRCIGFISANTSMDTTTMTINRGRIAFRSAAGRWVSSLASATVTDFVAALGNGPTESHRPDFLQTPALVRTIP